MGKDAHIYVACDGIEDGRIHTVGTVALEPGETHPEGATHSLDIYERLWTPEYPRGDWPMICMALMRLLASSTIKRVWYGSEQGVREFSAKDVLEYSRVFMEDRPRW